MLSICTYPFFLFVCAICACVFSIVYALTKIFYLRAHLKGKHGRSSVVGWIRFSSS